MYMRAIVYNEDYCVVMKKFVSYIYIYIYFEAGRRIMETTLVSDFEPIYFFERV